MSSLTSSVSNYITVMVGFEFACVKGSYIDACVQQTDGTEVPSVMEWGASHFGARAS